MATPPRKPFARFAHDIVNSPFGGERRSVRGGQRESIFEATEQGRVVTKRWAR